MLKTLKRAGIGFMLGVIISDIISILATDSIPVSKALLDFAGSPRAALLIQFFLAGAYGALCMGTVGLYDIERLPLTLSSVLHCLICIVPFIPLSLFLGWSDSIGTTLIMTVIQVGVYFIIWLIIFLRCRAEIRKMNEKQEEIRGRNQDE